MKLNSAATAIFKASATGSIRLAPRRKREPQLIVRMLLARIGKSIGKAQPFEAVPHPADLCNARSLSIFPARPRLPSRT
jgi:hypothetical protein